MASKIAMTAIHTHHIKQMSDMTWEVERPGSSVPICLKQRSKRSMRIAAVYAEMMSYLLNIKILTRKTSAPHVSVFLSISFGCTVSEPTCSREPVWPRPPLRAS